MYIEAFVAILLAAFFLFLLGYLYDSRKIVFITAGALLLIVTGLLVGVENIDIETGKTVELLTNTTWVENSTVANITDVDIDTLTSENHTYTYTSLDSNYQTGIMVFLMYAGLGALLTTALVVWEDRKDVE